jgi:hypothetical protein
VILLRYDQTAPFAPTAAAAYAAGWRSTVQDGHPPMPDLDTELRAVLHDPSRADQRPAEHPRWHAGDTLPWDAVHHLMRAGRYGEATALAEVIRWCEARATRRDDVIWEVQP